MWDRHIKKSQSEETKGASGRKRFWGKTGAMQVFYAALINELITAIKSVKLSLHHHRHHHHH